jgi:hypothetical protein
MRKSPDRADREREKGGLRERDRKPEPDDEGPDEDRA